MLRYMHELGKAVPIIPVITKADTMTIREAQNYKQEVFSRLQVRGARRARARARIPGAPQQARTPEMCAVRSAQPAGAVRSTELCCGADAPPVLAVMPCLPATPRLAAEPQCARRARQDQHVCL